MKATLLKVPIVVGAALCLTACPAPEEQPPPFPPAPSVEPDVALPDTTGEDVWAYLLEADYREWQRWPGTPLLYEGTEPHGVLLSTFLNDRAHGALVGGDGPLPTGSIIVKESYDADTTLVDITVMYSAEGYNPRHNDYFWAKYGPGGTVDMAGRLEMCQECHQTAERGYLMTPLDLTPPGVDDPWEDADPAAP